ncbi:hypothetical protein N7522_007337 [Penicillium canescens]|nr:hypothetical protein N7522_007337 [Penicillium canescens]
MAKNNNPPPAGASKEQATNRLNQLSSHISPTKQKTQANRLPADHSDVLTQITNLRTIAATPDPKNRGYIRQKQAGKLWVRERIDQLLDANTFTEIGSVSGTVTWAKTGPMREKPVAFVPSNNVQGAGLLRGRKVLLTADDFSIRSGHADGASTGKTVYVEKLAIALRIPVVKLVDGSSGQLNMGIPNLGAVVGPAIGLGAARVVSCHFSVMAADIGALFNAGPKVVEGATFEEGLDFQDLGGPMVHYPEDREDIALRSIIPRRQARMYNARTIITSVVDQDSWFEIGALWGRTAIGGLARLGGRPVGIISLNCEVNGGALDAAGSQKLTRLLKLCDVMNLPILQFLDVPGYAIGTVAERTATMRWGVELAKAYFSTTVPVFNVVTRRVFGVAGGVMLGCRDPVMQVAWPSGQWGSLPLDGGIEVGHRHELREAEKVGKKEERYQELEEEYLRLMNPVRTANAFGIEEIIDPKDTRKVCCSWAEHVYEVLIRERLAARASGKISPTFA